VTVDSVRQHVWTFIELMGVITIQLFSWFVVRATCAVGENVTHCCLVLGQFAFLLVCGLTDVFVGTRARIALAAISEYTILVLLPMFFFSFSRDLATVSQLRVIHIDSTEWIGPRCRSNSSDGSRGVRSIGHSNQRETIEPPQSSRRPLLLSRQD
jgi:hypothetical protein